MNMKRLCSLFLALVMCLTVVTVALTSCENNPVNPIDSQNPNLPDAPTIPTTKEAALAAAFESIQKANGGTFSFTVNLAKEPSEDAGEDDMATFKPIAGTINGAFSKEENGFKGSLDAKFDQNTLALYTDGEKLYVLVSSGSEEEAEVVYTEMLLSEVVRKILDQFKGPDDPNFGNPGNPETDLPTVSQIDVSKVGPKLDTLITDYLALYQKSETAVREWMKNQNYPYSYDDMMAMVALNVKAYKQVMKHLGYESTVVPPETSGSVLRLLAPYFKWEVNGDTTTISLSLSDLIDKMIETLDKWIALDGKTIRQAIDALAGEGTTEKILTILDSIHGTDTVEALMERLDTELKKFNLSVDDAFLIAADMINVILAANPKDDKITDAFNGIFNNSFKDSVTADSLKTFFLAHFGKMTVNNVLAMLTKDPSITYEALVGTIKGAVDTVTINELLGAGDKEEEEPDEEFSGTNLDKLPQIDVFDALKSFRNWLAENKDTFNVGFSLTMKGLDVIGFSVTGQANVNILGTTIKGNFELKVDFKKEVTVAPSADLKAKMEKEKADK